MSRAAEEVFRRHRLSVGDYHCMGEAGIFGVGARVELMHGEIIDMAPIGSQHAGTVTRLGQLFFSAVRGNAIVYIQNPIVLDMYSEPEPDLALLKPREDFYAASHPGPEDVLLIVEVSDSSVRYDREVKIPLYGRTGIPESWILDLGSKQVEVYRQPGERGYQELLTPPAGERVCPVMLPAVSLPIDVLWPKV